MNNTEVTKIDSISDYFKIDAISSSRLNALDPTMGGSPKKFQDFVNQDIEKEENVSMERGSLIHLYIENKDTFKILEVDKPSEKLGDVADMAIKLLTAEIVEGAITLPTNEELEDIVLAACREVGWNNKWKDEAIIKNACTDGMKNYIKLMLDIESSGKIPMTLSTRLIVESCIASLEAHAKASEHLFTKPTETLAIFKEQAITWEDSKDDITFTCKAKIDHFEIDTEKKVIRIKDLKSGAFNISNFDSTFKYRRIYRQLAWYKKAITEFCSQKGIDILHWEWEYFIIAVETKDEFRTAVFPVPQLWIFKGISEYHALLDRYIFHRKNGFKMLMEEVQNNGYMKLNDPE